MPKKKTPVATAGRNGGRSSVVVGTTNLIDNSEALQDLQRRVHALPSPREQFPSGSYELHILHDVPDCGLYTLCLCWGDGNCENDDWAVCVSGLELLLRLLQWKADCPDAVTNWGKLTRECPRALKHLLIQGGVR